MKNIFFYLIFISLLTISSCRSITIQDYKISSDESFEKSAGEQANQLRILQISDFHSNDFGQNESILLEKVKNARPDLILLTGDIFDFRMKGKTIKNVAVLLEGISKIAPFFYVSGNHEYQMGYNDECHTMISEFGGKVLKDESVIFQHQDGEVIISGLYDPYSDLKDSERQKEVGDKKEKFRARLEKISDEAKNLKNEELSAGKKVLCSILATHRPEYAKDYEKTSFDMIFTGHAHGGQWRIPGLLNGLYAPGQGLFPKYAGGLVRLKRNFLIISRGLSYQCPNLPRIFNNPELVIVSFN